MNSFKTYQFKSLDDIKKVKFFGTPKTNWDMFDSLATDAVACDYTGTNCITFWFETEEIEPSWFEGDTPELWGEILPAEVGIIGDENNQGEIFESGWGDGILVVVKNNIG